MAKKRKSPTKSTPTAAGVTPERFVRVFRMVQLLAGGSQTREAIARRLRVDVRGFYRDLDLLRSSGVIVNLEAGRYSLTQNVDDALAHLPFPDPRLTLGAAQALAKGRGLAQRALAETIANVLPS
ncbi:MAG TPA: HTH domain-containing protein [Gemmataceae bacterium]|nr:HTH domain-containing protein [Gemmataceae bacterium]